MRFIKAHTALQAHKQAKKAHQQRRAKQTQYSPAQPLAWASLESPRAAMRGADLLWHAQFA